MKPFARVLSLALLGAVWSGCDCGGDEPRTPETAGATPTAVTDTATPAEAQSPGEGGSGSGASGEAAPDTEQPGSGAPDAEMASLWIGIYCSSEDGGPRTFSIYLDGSLVQEVDGRCRPGIVPGQAPPNAGQFTVSVPVGVRNLRVQDDTEDYYTEHEIPVPGDHWVYVHHRVLPDETGHFTAVIDHYERPPHAY